MAQTPFITTWRTDSLSTGSSNATSITIPTTGTGYNYDVDWTNDGTYDDLVVMGNMLPIGFKAEGNTFKAQIGTGCN